MFKTTIFILSILFAPAIGFGQDQVIQNTNLQELARMQEEFAARDLIIQAKIQAYAKEKGVLVTHYLPNGKVTSIVGFDVDGKPIYKQTDNAIGAKTTSTDKLFPSATVVSKYNCAGRGFTVGEWDGGTTRITHREFEGRAIQGDNGSMALSEHATHVAGTIIAGGVNATARGMAYQANLLTNDWENDDVEMASRASQGMLVSNHSYGTPAGWELNGNTWEWLGTDAISTQFDYKFGFYDTQARDWDRIQFNAPYYLIVKSAGNSRGSGPSNGTRPNNGPYDCIPTYSCAKNMLTVGAINGMNNGYTTPNAVIMSDFSSWGPTDDGRIKPDIVAKGVGMFSCGSATDVQYVTLQGTSMSSPSVAGSCILLQEIFSNSHYKKKMRSSTLKGIVIHTADEAGVLGTVPMPGPDYRFGWGVLNARKAADVILKDSITSIIQEATLEENQIKEFTVTSSGGPITATLCWTDYQGTPGPAALNSRLKMLVNDLDLRVINDANQEITLPWRLNPDSASSRARKNDNSVDNVEKIELPTSSAGQTYKIRVSHKGTLFAGQNQPKRQVYSLIVSGIVAGDTAATCIPLQYMNAKFGVFDDGSGTTKNYAHNADCGWIINPEDSGSIVQAVFTSFNVSASDTLYAYSGTDASGSLIGKFSGIQLPDTLQSTTSQMYLNFKTDGAGNSLGWTLKYSSVEKPDFDFGPDSKTICAGNSSTYTVTAKNGPATNWTYSWSLPGSSLSTSIAQSPTVNYGVEGVYSATVSVTNKAGTTTKTKNNVLTVKPQIAPNTAPYFEGFEGASFPVVNNDPSLTWTITADANTWTRNLLAPFSGVAAIRIRNATTKKDIRELVSPGFSLEGIPINEREILFKMAYARVSTAAAADQLRVLYSVNCGKTWVEVYKRSHTTTIKLSTIGDAATDVVASTFVPEPFQYRTETVSLASLPLSSPNVMIKFEMTSEKGNFLYLDDIRLTTNTSIENLTRANGLEISLRPNPSSNESTLFFRNATSPSLAVQLTDLTGRVLSTAQIAGLDGSSVQSASTSELFGKVPVGMYFIKVRTLGEEKIIRWIRN